jgi:hypothetical protein
MFQEKNEELKQQREIQRQFKESEKRQREMLSQRSAEDASNVGNSRREDKMRAVKARAEDVNSIIGEEAQKPFKVDTAGSQRLDWRGTGTAFQAAKRPEGLKGEGGDGGMLSGQIHKALIDMAAVLIMMRQDIQKCLAELVKMNQSSGSSIAFDDSALR